MHEIYRVAIASDLAEMLSLIIALNVQPLLILDIGRKSERLSEPTRKN